MAVKMVRCPPFHISLLASEDSIIVHDALALADEPMISQIKGEYGTLRKERTASQIADVNVRKRQLQKEYMEYWNSTSALTGTGRPVDAVISPIAPFAAARPNMFKYYGMCLLHTTLA
jgi:amidase